MANQLIIHFNVNEVLMEDVRKGKATQYLEVTVDGATLGRIGASHAFFIANGGHNIHLKYHHYNDYGGYVSASDFTCHCDFSCMVSDSDYEVTVNVYFLKKEAIDFVEGNEPFDPAKAKPKGCYVATCVYGSYDCPQVWTLRRFRDDTLGVTWYGRAFIRTYYAISPTLVKWFGETAWFKKLWKGKLDSMVAKLQANGVESTPYEDKNW